MPGFVEFSPIEASPLREMFRGVSDDALDLLSRLVNLDARRRISASEALKHRYFRVDPAPTPRGKLPRPHKKDLKPKDDKKRNADFENGDKIGPLLEGGTKRRRPNSDDEGDLDAQGRHVIKLTFDGV